MRSVTWIALLCWVTWGYSVHAGEWQPTQPIQLIVPAGPGGGGDQIAHLIQEIAEKYRLAPQPISVLNKAGSSGAEGYLYVKKNKHNQHVLIVTLSNIFTVTQVTNAKFNWQDLTPISMMALDEFVLWVNADSPYRSAKEYIDAIRSKPATFKMGGTGTSQEDEIVTRALERSADVKILYVPLKGGGDVVQALADKQIDSSVNNPIEAVKLWQAGKLRPLGVFDSHRMDYNEPIADQKSWRDIPTMNEQGYRVEYLMMRGIFAAPNVSSEARDYYVKLMKQIAQTKEWKAYLKKGALKDKFVVRTAFHSWLTFTDNLHQSLLPK